MKEIEKDTIESSGEISVIPAKNAPR